MKKYLVLFIIFCCCSGEKKTNSYHIIDLLPTPEVETVNLSEIAVDARYIPLETKENSLIGLIWEIRSTDEYFYISTLYEIICFDKAGRYECKLSKYGRGPDEYLHIYSFDVSSDNNYIVIKTKSALVLYKRDGNSFNFQRRMDLNPNANKVDFTPDQNNILLSYGTELGIEPFRYLLLKINGDTLSSVPNQFLIPHTGAGYGSLSENISFLNNNALHFKHQFNDTIYMVDRFNKIVPYLVLNSGGRIATLEENADGNYYAKHVTEFLSMSNLMETSRFFFYEFSLEGSTRFIIYDKVLNTRKRVNKPTWLKDDLSGGLNFEPRVCYGETIISWRNALSLKQHIVSEIFKNSVVIHPEKKKELEELANSLKETDNPVLIIVTPKK